jgi:hypothetical protein
MTLTIINQTVLRAPFQTIHNLIPYMRYLSKQSIIPFHTLGTDHNPNCTLGTFPNHPHSQSIHDVPCQAIHNPMSYTRYQPQPNLYSVTFPIQPPSQSVHKVPCQAIHIPNPYVGYQAKPLHVNSHLVGWKTTTRQKRPQDNSASRKMEVLNEVSSYFKINDSTTNL